MEEKRDSIELTEVTKIYMGDRWVILYVQGNRLVAQEVSEIVEDGLKARVSLAKIKEAFGVRIKEMIDG